MPAGVAVRAWRSAQRFLSVGEMCVAEVSARSLLVTRWALMKIEDAVDAGGGDGCAELDVGALFFMGVWVEGAECVD